MFGSGKGKSESGGLNANDDEVKSQTSSQKGFVLKRRGSIGAVTDSHMSKLRDSQKEPVRKILPVKLKPPEPTVEDKAF